MILTKNLKFLQYLQPAPKMNHQDPPKNKKMMTNFLITEATHLEITLL